MVRLPPKSVCWATLRITILVWLMLRVMLAGYNQSPSILPPVSLFLMLGVAVIAVVDITVARERLLLGNLGVGRRGVVGISLLVSGTLEIASMVVVHALGLGG